MVETFIKIRKYKTTRRIWEARIIKNKERGRLRTTWNNVSETLGKKGKTWTEAKNMTRNNNAWRKFIRS